MKINIRKSILSLVRSVCVSLRIPAAAALAALLAHAPAAHAKVTLPAIFADGMVLQRESKANIWGWASPRSQVSVRPSWDKNTTVRVRADEQGRWKCSLSTPGAGGPHSITISDGTPLTLRDILMGEVWVCSGQSNMEMPMEGFKMQPVEGATDQLMECDDDQMRLFTVKRNSSFVPLDTLTGRWSAANAASVRSFSAAAYYFGRQLRRSLGVPVGLIVAAWGGSSSEAWMAREWLSDFPETQPENNIGNPKNLYVVPQSAADIRSKNRTPTALYNGMLHPIIGYTMKGVIWYQGEDNVPRYKSYARMQKAMIEGWRRDWAQGDFPFLFCQIAPYDYSLIGWKANSAFLREQQQMVEQTVANTGMAVLMDAGLEYGIHPRMKREAGLRLAMLALADAYGVKGLAKSARYEGVEFKDGVAEVRFDRSRMWVYFQNGTESHNFELAGPDRVFHPAKAVMGRNRVLVSCPEVPNPVAVRYAFKNWAVGDLFCDGLPVGSFRSDDWDDVVDTSAGVEYDRQ